MIVIMAEQQIVDICRCLLLYTGSSVRYNNRRKRGNEIGGFRYAELPISFRGYLMICCKLSIMWTELSISEFL